MPTVGFGRLSAETSHEELINVVAKMQKTLDYLMQGGLDSKNAREFGGWRVNNDELVSKDGDVGMSTADTGADDVRFWAGAPGNAKETAPWRVLESGKEFSTGAYIESASGYPKIIMDPDTNLLKIMTDANKYIEIAAADSGLNIPLMQFRDGSTGVQLYQTAADGFAIVGIGATDVALTSSSGDVTISGGSISLLGNIITTTGANGSFTTVDGKTVIVSRGIITSII